MTAPVVLACSARRGSVPQSAGVILQLGVSPLGPLPAFAVSSALDESHGASDLGHRQSELLRQ